MVKENVSARGKFVRELIRKFIHSSGIQVNGFLRIGAKFSKNNKLWITPCGYKLTRYNLNDIPIEILECKKGKKDKIILHLHGGAYVIGYLTLYRFISLKYSKVSKGATVVSVDYKVAPKYHYPSALEDAQTAWEWCLQQGYSSENIIIVGDSAGGNLAVALTAKLRDEGKALPRALVLMCPWLDLAANGESYMYNLYKDPLFGFNHNESVLKSLEDKSLISSYMGGANAYDKYVSPIYGEFNGFPSMLIQVGTYEVLESDSVTLYEKAKKVGVDARLTKYEGMFHTFQLFGEALPESKNAWKEVEEYLKSINF
jgi:acetyl esterase/lipase